MAADWPVSPWTEERRGRVSFALQAFPIDTKDDPGRQLLASGRLAEQLGFDAFFCGDHPAWGLDPWVHLAALAVTTDRIGLGLNVSCVAYRHPVLTARLAADVDNLSRGRLILGLGTGWDAHEFGNFGLPFPPARERQAVLEETLTIVRGVWGDAPFTFQGRYFQTVDTRVAPPPAQRPSPPVMIAGGGEQVTLRQVAEHADACNLLGGAKLGGAQTPDAVRRKLAVLGRHCDRLGRPYETILRTYTPGWVILAEDERRLAAKMRHYFPEGVEQRYAGDWSGWAAGYTPAQAVAHFQALVDAGIQYFIVQLMDAADHETIHLLADRVLSQVGA
jgi:alkanesulfonate monooxygenase SsuD/methylene tetrahydromethanopterin reductase-like flavin-dependent oxidoreductase (luciferase family)